MDGAVFAFARATDPDVLLLLEARAKTGEDPKWHYALARMHCGELCDELSGPRSMAAGIKWTQPFARPNGAYTLFQGIPEPHNTLTPEP